MKAARARRRQYDASGRQAQAQLTRDAIVDAAMLRLRKVRPEELSYAELASEVGVAVRTVYRHFPTLDDLLAAALEKFLDRVGGTSTLEDKSLAELGDVFARLHERLTAEPGLYRLFFALPTRSKSGFVAMIERLCGDTLARIPPAHHAAVCAAVDLMLSPYAWEVFHTHWRVPPARMTRALLASVQVLLERFAAHPEMLDPDGAPLPLLDERTRTRKKR